MGNNMDLDYEMFCYQCEQTANGKGCTRLGVCGKTPEIANLQDLLIYQVKGISCYGKVLSELGHPIEKAVIAFIESVLFTTLTNVNFDAEVHVQLLQESQKIKDSLRKKCLLLKAVPIFMTPTTAVVILLRLSTGFLLQNLKCSTMPPLPGSCMTSHLTPISVRSGRQSSMA